MAISELALEMGLHKYYIISKHVREKNTNLSRLFIRVFLSGYF